MTSVAVKPKTAIYEDDLLLDACKLAVEQTREIADLFTKIGEVSSKRGLALQTIFMATGREMIAKGQKTRRVGPYTIEAGIERVIICVCHGAYLRDCDTVGVITTVERKTGEPYIRVRLSSEAREDAS